MQVTHRNRREFHHLTEPDRGSNAKGNRIVQGKAGAGVGQNIANRGEDGVDEARVEDAREQRHISRIHLEEEMLGPL